MKIIDHVLTNYAEQGQYSPNGLEAIWPIYRNQTPKLPTGLAQAAYTKFINLPLRDQLSAFPLVLAFSEFDDTEEAWEKYDKISFRDLCTRLGVSKRCYKEAFEPMILTGLFAPGVECSAAAALGMAYFFVLSNQQAFDVRWCKGNIGEQIFDPWIQQMKTEVTNPVQFQLSTKVTGFTLSNDDEDTTAKSKPTISGVRCIVEDGGSSKTENVFEADEVVFAVGGAALNFFVKSSPQLSQYSEFRNFAGLRGTSVLATRLYLDRTIDTPYTANACHSFDDGVGMTFFNIKELHGDNFSDDAPGSVIEVDYYHSDTIMVMSDEDIAKKAKRDLDTMLGAKCAASKVIDAAIVRLPNAVNWYYPDSYKKLPSTQSTTFSNVYFAGDLVKTRHGSWSQEKAFVTGIEAANLIRGLPLDDGIIPLPKDEYHVAFGRTLSSTMKSVAGFGDKSKAPSLVDFLF